MIRFEHICAGYDGVERLHDISCEVPAGKLTALIGPNGSGKSTLLKTAAGIIRPDRGTITAEGRDIAALDHRERARILAYMPQSRPAPEMTVDRLVAHGRYPRLKWGRSLTPADREIIREAMVRTDTLSLRDIRLDKLSGGERQRAYLAMMLAQQAPVMLLDEPAAHLDLRAQYDMIAILKDLAQAGRTVLVVMHDIVLALENCDHVLLMDHGRIAASGAPDQVYDTGLLAPAFGIRVDHPTPATYHTQAEPARNNCRVARCNSQ